MKSSDNLTAIVLYYRPVGSKKFDEGGSTRGGGEGPDAKRRRLDDDGAGSEFSGDGDAAMNDY